MSLRWVQFHGFGEQCCRQSQSGLLKGGPVPSRTSTAIYQPNYILELKTMSGLGKHLKKLKESQSKVKNIWKKFTSPSVHVGGTVFPKTQSDQAKIGFRWDRDVEVTTSDGRKANRFKLQANAQAQSPSIQEFIRRQAKKGTYADITYADVPTDATEDEAKKILEDAVDDVN